MKFWEIYFTYVEALKQRLSVYESLLAQWPQDSAQPIPVIRTSKKPEFTSKSILVIEPLERNRILISRYMTALSVQVSFVSNEQEANGRAAGEKFDLKINTTGLKFPEDKISLIDQL